VSRTAGGHRRIDVPEAVRFARDSGLPVVRPDVLGVPGLDEPARQRVRQAMPGAPLLKALEQGHADEARAMILSWYLDGWPMAEVFDGPMRLALDRLGELWQHREDGIFIEHRATEICLRAIQEMRALLPPVDDDAPGAIGGTPAGDVYQLTTAMACATLQSVGLRSVNLGADCPAAVFRQAAGAHEPGVVWISAMSEQAVQRERADLQALAEELADAGIHVVVGGRFARQLRLPDRPRVDHLASMSELAGFARGLWART
jgi:methanogenic corrinoid protein MtbC1